MPETFSRSQRIADQIQRDLAGILQTEIRDPRVGMATISEVKISKDLSYADIYVTLMGIEETAEARKLAVDVLNQAAGYIRTRLGKLIRLRVVPALRFHYDESLARGRHLTDLINQTMREDQDVSPSSDNETNPLNG